MALHSLSTLSEYFHWDYLLHRNYGLHPAIRVLSLEAHGLSALTSAYCIVSDAPVLSRWFGVHLHVVLFWLASIHVSAAAVILLARDHAMGLDAGLCLVLSILSLL